jgi:hypothetical protein
MVSTISQANQFNSAHIQAKLINCETLELY